MELILASNSARRRELMANCGYDFTVLPADADESIEESDPALLVRRLALIKARAVYNSLDSERRGNAVVVGADTVVVLEGRIIGKPRDEADAREILLAESGRLNTVYTGVAVVTPFGEQSGFDKALVHFSELTEDEIASYIATGEPMDKAGAYGIQGRFSMFVEGIEGSYFTVVGLPVHLLYQMLKTVGVMPRDF